MLWCISLIFAGHTDNGDERMKNSHDVLSSVIKTTQMGQIGIRSLLNMPLEYNLQAALKEQLKEYDKIEREAMDIAMAKGWTPNELDPSIQYMTNMMTRTRLFFGNANSKAAAMMIQGNTRGLIKGYKNLNQYEAADSRILALSHKLLGCEESNIRQMQGFL
jgi:hypothetical protein